MHGFKSSHTRTVSRSNQDFVEATVVAAGHPCARNTGRMNHIEDRREPVLGGDIDKRMRVPIASNDTAPVLGTALPVLDAQTLIDRLELGSAIAVLRIKLAFPAQVFVLAARPLIDCHAEFVQMLPVSGSGRFAGPGGQLHRAFATTIQSLDRRRGQILPRGAAPEAIGEQAHRWTYAVFVAALLRDVVRVTEGLRVSIAIGTDRPLVWSPAMGSMRSCGAFAYRSEAVSPGALSDAVDPANRAIAMRLFEHCVPTPIQNWLRENPVLMAELHASLSGQADPAGAIRKLVTGDAPRRSLDQTPVVSRAPVAPVKAPVVEAGVPAGRAIATVNSLESLEEVRPDESTISRQFMAWLRQGVLGGTLPVNTPDALVYVVAEGLLLTSPRIFREFAKQQVVGLDGAADAAKHVQREVLREGWHLRADRGVNILCYEHRRSDRGITRINGIVIREPQRFIQSLPAIDLMLVRVVDGAGHSG